MTNGSPEWVEELKKALMKDYPWKQISSSWQMQVNWEQMFTAQAVDMMIGQRADVFIGNGVRVYMNAFLSDPHFYRSYLRCSLVLESNWDSLYAADRKWARAWTSETLAIEQR